MKRTKTIYFITLFTLFGLISCAEKGIVNVDLNQGYSEFEIQSKDREVKSVSIQLIGESSCEVAMLVSKQKKVDTIGTGIIDFTKSYPWRSGPFKIKMYSPRCSGDGPLTVNYTFNK